MIQIRSLLKVADNTGAKFVRVMLIHGGHKHPKGSVGDIVTAVVEQADPHSTVNDKQVVKAVVVRTRKEVRRDDGTYIRFDDNAAVIIDSIAGKAPLGSRIFGPVAREVKDAGFAKIASLAPEVL